MPTLNEQVRQLRERVKYARVTQVNGTDEAHDEACRAVENLCSVTIIEHLFNQIDEYDRELAAVGKNLKAIVEQVEGATHYPLNYY